MINIDKFAYASKLKRVDPLLKLIFAVMTLGVCLWADSPVISIMVLIMVGWIIVRKGGIPFSFFVKLLLLPMSFLVIGVLTTAVNFAKENQLFIISLPIGDTFMGVSRMGLYMAVRLFLKALGSVSCLYFLSLSTPMVDLIGALRRLKVPKLLVEMMALTYRFIFILLETADTIFTAQDSRLGYASLSTGYRSLGALASTLFIRSYKRADEVYTALEARGYDKELNVLEEPFERKWSGYMAAVVINAFLISAALIIKRLTGGLL